MRMIFICYRHIFLSSGCPRGMGRLEDPDMRFLLLAVAALAIAASPAAERRVDRVLAKTPLVDGHNDLPWEIREKFGRWAMPLDLSRGTRPLQTDIPRLRAGGVGAQFWSVWIPSTFTGPAAIEATLEQIDIVHELVRRYPRDFELAGTAADIRRAHKAGRIASLIGIEGGHQIGNSPAALRQFHALGARYMTLTHSQHNDWADSATADPKLNGLSRFGLAIVKEMNRLGMMVDLSHVSPAVMKQAIAASRAPVIFSHSGARAIADHPRNVPDEVLRLLPANGGVVMIVFYPGFLSEARMRWSAERDGEEARLAALHRGDPDGKKAALDAWDNAHPPPPATIADVIAHIEHVRRVAGIDHVGLGSDYDGISGTHPEGMAGVEGFRPLLEALAAKGWSEADLARLAGGNILRAMEGAERAERGMREEAPLTATIAEMDGPR